MTSPTLWARPAVLCLLCFLAPDLPAQDLGPLYDLAVRSQTDLGTPRLELSSDRENGQSGKIVRTGDLNGDGVDDVIVAGQDRVHVWHGAPPYRQSGSDTTFFAHLTLTGMDAVQGVEVGDVNGDGLDDLVLALMQQGYVPYHYAAVVFGSTSRSRRTLSVGPEAGSSAHTLLTPPNGYGEWGRNIDIRLGDINGDGKADMLFGASDIGHATQPGTVHVLLGRSNFPTTIFMDDADSTIIGRTAGDGLGSGGAMMVADVNGDGYGDVLIGAAGGDGLGENLPDAGEVYIIPGAKAGLPQIIHMRHQYPPELQVTTIFGHRAGDALTGGEISSEGAPLNAADVNGDGILDVLISAQQAGAHGRPGSGAVYAVYGRALFQRTMVFGSTRPNPEVVPNLIIYGERAGDRLTEWGTLKTGDVNADGIDDLVLGAPRTAVSLATTPQSATAYIVPGLEHPLFAPPRTVDLNSYGLGDVVKLSAGSAEDGLMDDGALLVADVTGDGVQDIVLGAPGMAAHGGERAGAGQVFIVRGRDSFPHQLIMSSPGFNGATTLVQGAQAGDGLACGGAMAVGDVTGDGAPDLILGAPGADRGPPGFVKADVGEAYVVGGSAPRPEVSVSIGGHRVPEAPMPPHIPMGRLGIGVSHEWTVTVKNLGLQPLNLSKARLYNDFEKEFDLNAASLPSVMAPKSQATCTIRVKARKSGPRAVKFELGCNDPSEGASFVMQLNVVEARLPNFLPVDMRITGATSALASAIIENQGAPVVAELNYGTSKSLRQSLSLSMPVGAPEYPALEFPLTQLRPHTRYYYQLRVHGPLGEKSSPLLSFITPNRVPTLAHATHEVSAVSLGVIWVPIQDHAIDADGDPLTLASFTQPASGGRVFRAKDTAVFHADATFSDQAEPAVFNMVIKDSEGASATLVVQVNPATVSLPNSELRTGPMGGSHELPLTFSPGDAAWTTQEKTSWLSIIESHDASAPAVTIRVSTNTSVKARTAELVIAGRLYAVIQAGVSKPSISLPTDVDPSIAHIARAYHLPILTVSAPVKYRVTGLPPGLACSSLGEITGFPTKAGKYDVTVTASNAADTADEKLEFTINVQPLDPSLVGPFYGLTTGNGTIDLTAASTGIISGKVTNLGKTTSFRSRWEFDSEAPGSITFVTRPVKNKPGWEIRGSFNSQTKMLEGVSDVLEFFGLSAWRSGWKTDATPPAAYAGKYSFRLRGLLPTSREPEGDGYGTFSVHEKTGSLTLAGRLPDGTVYLSGAYLGDQGQIRLYQSLYRKRGLLTGKLSILADPEPARNTLSSAPDFPPWWRKPDTIRSRNPEGFELTLEAQGGRLPVTAPGGTFMDLADGQATLQFVSTSTRGAAAQFNQDFTLTNPSATGTTNRAAANPPLANETTLSVNPKTGAFKGDFILRTGVPSEKRVVPYRGQLVDLDGEVQGYGYFLLPDLPNPKRSPVFSGRVLLKAAEAE